MTLHDYIIKSLHRQAAAGRDPLLITLTLNSLITRAEWDLQHDDAMRERVATTRAIAALERAAHELRDDL